MLGCGVKKGGKLYVGGKGNGGGVAVMVKQGLCDAFQFQERIAGKQHDIYCVRGKLAEVKVKSRSSGGANRRRGKTAEIIDAFSPFPSAHLHAFAMETNPRRAKRQEYRRQIKEQQPGSAGDVKLPQKKFFRQRAHANPFSDHQLE